MARLGSWIESHPEGIGVAPAEAWITHGREEALKHWCKTHPIKACELNLVGYEDEDE